MKTPDKLRANPLWRETYAIAGYMYDKIYELIANFPDEQWTTASKLRNSANDSLFYISQAIGSAAPEVSKYDWSNARKNLFSLQSMYTFAGRQKFLELEPEIVVRIDALLGEIDKRIVSSNMEAKKKDKEDLEPWLEKYRLWQKIQDQHPEA
jgi:hypothetical protein